MVDNVRVLRLLRSITDDLAFLRREAEASPNRQSDPLWMPAVKYTFVTAIEAAIDIAQHLAASEGWGPPRDNGDAFLLLGKHGVLDAGLADAMRQAAGFRNVLVHEYVVVDDAIVVDALNDPSDLNGFVRSVSRWLEDQV